MNTLTKRLLWIAVCCLPFISGCKQPNENAVSKNAISDALYRNLPFEMPEVQQPAFPAYEVNIEKFGAKGDGLFLNTKAINDAIKDVNQRGGGKVIIPEGIWLTGPIELLSNVNLYTEQNALVLFTGDFEASSTLLLKGWKPVVASHRSRHGMRRISLSPAMARLMVTEIAGVR